MKPVAVYITEMTTYLGGDGASYFRLDNPIVISSGDTSCGIRVARYGIDREADPPINYNFQVRVSL